MDPGSGEASSLGWRGGVEGEAVTVDHDMVMEPAQRRQVLRVGSATFGPRNHVMRLHATSRDAGRSGAEAAVTMQDEPAQTRRDDP